MEDVEAAVGIDRPLDHRLGVGGVGHVGAGEEGFAASGLNLREGFFATRLVDIDNHDFGPFFGEERSGGPAHARAGAGDQGDLSCECGHFHSPLRQKKTSGRLVG